MCLKLSECTRQGKAPHVSCGAWYARSTVVSPSGACTKASCSFSTTARGNPDLRGGKEQFLRTQYNEWIEAPGAEQLCRKQQA